MSTSFALVGHGGDGKTTLADSLLMAAGVTNRLGSVEDGSSYMNWLPEEKIRRLTISASVCSFEHDGNVFCAIDAPGDANFAGEIVAALNAVDNAVLVLSAREGVRIGTERAFQQARQRGIAVTAVANKMDLDRADFDACASQLEEMLGVRVVKLHLPLGAADTFAGYVDLLSGKVHRYADDGSGKVEISDATGDLAGEVESQHMEMVEAVAEADDSVLEKYLEEGEITDQEVIETLRRGLREGTLVPLLCACASKNIGGDALLQAAARFFPTASDVPARSAERSGEEVELAPNENGPLAALVFKSIADRYTGMLSVLRVFSGKLEIDSTVSNARTGSRERITKLLRVTGEHTAEVTAVRPGEIAAVPKLKDTRTGDTLCAERDKLAVPAAAPPAGVISFAVEAANKGEEDKVFESLNRLVEEDPSLKLGRDERTGEFLLTGLGQLHTEVTLEKLRRLFGVDVTLKPPKVPYLETIKGRAENIEGKLKKQSGGRGQFGVCYLTVEPGERGSGVDFLDEIVGGSIPRQFIPAVKKGVREACERGTFAGYPLTDIVVHCIDGKHHSVDSSEMAFKTAGSLGIKAAVAAAKPILLEPVMNLEVSVSDEHVGDVMGDLNSRRGKVAGVDARGHVQVVKAQVPMAEVLRYASELTSMTGGQGDFSMEFSHYEEVPKAIQEKIAAQAAASDD